MLQLLRVTQPRGRIQRARVGILSYGLGRDDLSLRVAIDCLLDSLRKGLGLQNHVYLLLELVDVRNALQRVVVGLIVLGMTLIKALGSKVIVVTLSIHIGISMLGVGQTL